MANGVVAGTERQPRDGGSNDAESTGAASFDVTAEDMQDILTAEDMDEAWKTFWMDFEVDAKMDKLEKQDEDI